MALPGTPLPPPRAASLLLALALAACDGRETAAPSGFAEGVNGPPGQRAALERGPFLPLSVQGRTIVDAAGRTAILRGLQHHALQDVGYQGREVLEGDYDLIASWGLTTLRMAISWSRIEPTRGSYDDAYLGEIEAAMDAAHAANLTVVLEWHQDLWAKCAVAPDDALANSANGAPAWTCPPSYVPQTLAYLELFDHLWANDDGLLDAFVEAWGRVIDRLGAHPALAGYDVLNEPQGSGGSPAFERDRYFPALRTIVPAMRARGAKGLLFAGAPGMRNETFEMHTEPLDAIDPDLVYAPHLYTGWIGLYILKVPPLAADKQKDFALAAAQAEAIGLPLWDGEWGVNLDLPTALADLEVHVGLEDAHRIGSSYWAFNRAIAGQGNASISGGQSLLNEDRSVRQEVVDRIARPYPIQIPGSLEELSYDFAARSLAVRFVAGDAEGPLVLYAPRRHLGSAICLEVDGPAGLTWYADDEAELVLVQPGASGAHGVVLRACE